MHPSNDEMIIRGLLYEEYKAYEPARQIFATLYDQTGEQVYLFKEATDALMGNTHIPESIQRLKAWDSKHPDSIEVNRLLIPLYLTVRETKKAKKQAEFLLEKSNKPRDLELASNPFLYTGEFKRALDILSKIYEQTHREDILLRMTDIMDEYTGQRKNAIQLLETHRRMNISSKDVYAKLLILYGKEKDIDGIIETYKALYKQDPREIFMQKIIEGYAYKRDLGSAVKFMEEMGVKSQMLYDLYKVTKQYDKALKLADYFYHQTGKPKWLAEKAILTYESAKRKEDKEMIARVIKLFDEAISLGVDDSVYLNYYGYTLIDKDIDVAKGMKIIQNALKQQPDNTYYLDSLAWGYYKEHQCDKAFKTMKRVVEEEGLEEPEIIEHWRAIKQCK
jgi:tetratricopeptide (TPR) repeat protein